MKKRCTMPVVFILFAVLIYPFFRVGASDPQQEQISMKFKDELLSDVLKRFESLSGYKVLFIYDDVRDIRISGSFQNKSVSESLDVILNNTPLSYIITGKYINIKYNDNKKQSIPRTPDDYIIRGRIVDEKNEAIIGANVLLLESNSSAVTGVATDINGDFELTAEPGRKLRVSYLGYIPQDVEIKDNSFLTIRLKEDVAVLNEVVVTGYQVLDKSKVAGSVATIQASELSFDGINNLEQALQGRLAGVSVTNMSGLVGVRQKTRIRGASTLFGNADPVWVVDGIIQEDPLPISSETLKNLGDINDDNFDYIRFMVGNAVSWLNPNDIESITVLKDASSTAIYGVRAANGVIVIKTKRGKAGGHSVSYSSNWNITDKVTYDKLERMNSKDRIAVSKEIFERGLTANWTNNSVGFAALLDQYQNKQLTYDQFNVKIRELETVNTDWFNLLFRDAFSQNHSLSVSGGSSTVRYYTSFGYNATDGTAIGNDIRSYSANFRFDMNITPKLTVAARLSGSKNKTNGFNLVSPYAYAFNTSRAIPAYESDGNLSFYRDSDSRFLFNIMNERDQSGVINNSTSVNAGVDINYDIMDGLRFQTLFGYATNNTSGVSYATERTEYIATIRSYDYGTVNPNEDAYKASRLPVGGEYKHESINNATINWRNTLSYSKIFNDKHALTTMVGVEINSSKYDGNSFLNYGYLRDRGKSFAMLPIMITAYGSQMPNELLNKVNSVVTDRLNNVIGSYLTLNYAYDNRYVLNASVRNDASNRFGRHTNENFNPIWAGGIRWNVYNEEWFKKQNIVSNLSLRASFGFQRNMAKEYSPGLIVKIPTGSQSNIIDQFTGEDMLKVSSLPYGNLRWEKTLSTNFGADMGLIDNKIRFSVEYYMKNGRDMITTLAIPLEYGIESIPINGGSLNNHGVEVSVGLTPIRTSDITWSLNLNTSKNFNEVKKAGIQTPTWQTAVSGALYQPGVPVSGFWAFDYEGIDPDTGYPIIDLTAKEGTDPQSDPTAYMVYVGKLDPDFTGGLSTQFRYKRFNVSSSFYLQLGGKRFLAPAYSSAYLPSEYENLSTELNNRWTPQNRDADFPGLPDKNATRIALPNGSSYLNVYEMYNYSTARVVSATSLRCNNISLTYSLPDRWASSVFCKSIFIGTSMNNVFSIVSKDFKGRDAEVATGQQPRTRSYALNLSVTF